MIPDRGHYGEEVGAGGDEGRDRKSTRLNSSHANISYAVFCLKKKEHHCRDSDADLLSDRRQLLRAIRGFTSQTGLAQSPCKHALHHEAAAVLLYPAQPLVYHT